MSDRAAPWTTPPKSTPHALALGIALGLLGVSPSLMARDLIGGSATVNAGDAPEVWNVRNNALLTITPGGQSFGMTVIDSALSFDGATVNTNTANGGAAITGTNATASIINSTINVPASFGFGSNVNIASSTFQAPAGDSSTALQIQDSSGTITGTTFNGTSGEALAVARASTVTVTDSDLHSDSGDAVVSSLGAVLNLVNSRVSADAQRGVRVVEGTINATAGTVIAGATSGAWMTADRFAPSGPSVLDLDDATLVGATGPAIFVSNFRPTAPATIADIRVRNGSTVTSGNGNLLEADENTTTTLLGDNAALTGNVIIATGATADLSFQNNASLAGALTNVTSLALADTSRWEVTGDSTVGTLDIGSGTLAFAAPSPGYKTVTVGGDFSINGGTLIFNSVLAGDDAPSDTLVINGNTAGTGSIAVNNIGGAGAQTTNGIQLISVAGTSGASFTLAGRATAGVYEYLLYKGGVTNPADGGWYLRSAYTGNLCDLNPSLPICGPVTPIDPVNPVDPVNPIDPVNPVDPVAPVDPIIPDPVNPIPILRPEPGAYLANQAAAVRMFQQRRHDRGEPAFEHDRAGAWARVSRDQLHTTIGGQVDARGHTNALQIGSDVVRWGQAGRGQIGVMLATGEATTQAISRITGYGTQGKVKGDALGLYGTWVQQPDQSGGLYVDGWVQYGRYDSEVRGNGLAAETYDATTRAASLEAGYGFALSATERRALYLQPQVQVTYTDYKGDTVQEANGTMVQDDRAGGLESRVGLRLFGQDLTTANRMQPFFAVNWLYSERGDAMRFDGQRLEAQLPTNRYEAQAGAQLRLGERWSAWGDLRVQRGDSGYRDAGAQIGLRRAW